MVQHCTIAMKYAKPIISKVLSVLLAGTALYLSANAKLLHTNAEELPEETGLIYTQYGEASEYGYIPVTYVDENGNEVEAPNLKPTKFYMPTNYPEYFNLRDEGYVTSVKNQGQTGSCWAHGNIAAAESNMIMKGLADTSIDLSEAHLVWFTLNVCKDESDPTYGDGIHYGTECYDHGGNHLMAQSVLARWSGVQLEENTGYINDRPLLDESQRYASYGHLAEGNRYDPMDFDSIKSHLMSKGALTVCFDVDSGCYSEEYASYYQPGNSVSLHELAIVGWDDNFSKENFAAGTPEGDGAWICKNSWGETFGDEGYCYVSYYDNTLRDIGSLEITTTDDYDGIYQYTGYVEFRKPFYEGVTQANVFEARKDENITAVSFFTENAAIEYTVAVYADTEEGNPMSGTLLTSQRGTIAYAGYHIVDLMEPVSVAEGTQFSVVVTFELDNEYIWLPFDNYAYGENCSYITSGIGTSESEWTNAETAYSANVCVKALTTDGILINAENFPDEIFRSYVSENFDTDSDLILSEEEITAVRKIDVNNMGIADLKGIEHFYYLENLSCSNNLLTSLDLSSNKILISLNCGQNQLNYLNISSCTRIGSIYCSDNQLMELDVSNCTKLRILNVNQNALIRLDLPSENNLEGVYCNRCQRQYDTFPCNGFAPDGLDMTKVSDVTGATVENGIFIPTDTAISYTYDCGSGYTAVFTLAAAKMTHSYSDWTNNGLEGHVKICTICGDTQTGTHEFGAWTGGELGHSHTCTICSGEITEAHEFGQWNDNGTNHIRVCLTCSISETDAHSYGTWKEADEITHKHTCENCTHAESEAHSFGEWADNGDATRSRTCAECSYSETEQMDFTPGDVNNDGSIDAFDLAIAKQGLVHGFSSSAVSASADVNQDGSFNVADIILLQRYLLRTISSFQNS